MNGYILESRSILNSAIWKMPPLYFKVWHFLLLKAQYTDYKGLKRGQLYTSIGEIREACSYYVGFRKETPTRKEIWSILEWLRSPHEEDAERNTKGNNERNMIVTTKATHGILVTICNFNVYQDPNFYEGNNERNTKGTMSGTRTEFEGNNINEEGIKNKNKKKNNPPYKSPQGDGEMEAEVNQLPLEMRSTMFDFIEHRKEIKKPFTARGLKMMIKKLSELSGGDSKTAVKIMEQSIANGWQGVFPLKEQNQNQKPISLMDRIRAGEFDE